MKNLLKITVLFTAVLLGKAMQAQQPALYHISTAEGLSDNNVITVARDRNGIVWIGTSEGLNSFDGNRITTYYKQQYAELPDNYIDRIVIDPDNKIWIRTNSSFVTMLDEKRRFHQYPVGDTKDGSNVSSLFVTSRGVFAIKNRKHYLLKKAGPAVFEATSTPFDSLVAGPGFTQFQGNDTVFYYRSGKLSLADYGSMKVILSMEIPGLNGARNTTPDKVMAYDAEKNVFYLVSIPERKILRTITGIRDQYGQPIAPTLRNSARIDENRLAITNYFSGFYIVDFSGGPKAFRYFHDPVDPRTLGGNNTFNIVYDTSGYLFITTQTSGLHFFNLRQQQASFKPYFTDSKSQIFDGYVQSVATDKADNVWMGAQDRMIRWNRKTDKTEYIPIEVPGKEPITGGETIRKVYVDAGGRIWVGTTRFGLFVLNASARTLKHITDSSGGGGHPLPSRWINSFCADRQGNMWVGTLSGTCIVNQHDFRVTSLKDHPLLSEMSKLPCMSLWMDEQENIWIGTSRGVWCYNDRAQTIKHFSAKDGMAGNTVYAINKDLQGNIYFATAGGLSVLSANGVFTNYDRSNGLRNDRCEGVLRDERGFMWVGNLNCIARFDPVSKTFSVHEEGYGFSHGGYRMRCAYASPTGEMFWGTDKGLVYFSPAQIGGLPVPLQPSIHSLRAGNDKFYFTGNEKVGFPYHTSSFVFTFSSGELSGDRKNNFLYKLSGFDDEWRQPSQTGQAVYSKLPPGHFTFMIKASRDGINWFDGRYPVTIIIQPPWWQQTWFRLLAFVAFACIAGILFAYFRRRRKRKMALILLNAKMAEARFLNLRLQMNPHFLFNSLSAIQHLIVSQQATKAYKYLTVFSNLLRSLLNFAEKNFVALDDELKILTMYVELESLRFDDSFQWEITADESLSQDEVFVPSLLVQPFAENAIWHGLLHKEGLKKLRVHFSGTQDDLITCVIEDNGIGRSRAAEIKRSNISSRIRESRGISIIKERLELLKQKTGKPAWVEIEDLTDENGDAAGTRVKIIIPYYNPEET